MMRDRNLRRLSDSAVREPLVEPRGPPPRRQQSERDFGLRVPTDTQFRMYRISMHAGIEIVLDRCILGRARAQTTNALFWDTCLTELLGNHRPSVITIYKERHARGREVELRHRE